jgi:hypothetical protein
MGHTTNDTPIDSRDVSIPIYSVKCVFSTKPDQKQYEFLTHFSRIIPGQELVVDMGTHRRVVHAVSACDPEPSEQATQWVVTPLFMEQHHSTVDIIKQQNNMEDTQ